MPVFFDISMWTVVSMIAVLRAGSAILSLDRLQYTSTKMQARLMLVFPVAAPLFASRVETCLRVTVSFLEGLRTRDELVPSPEALELKRTANRARRG